MHLRYDHPFGAIDDESAVVRHQRHVAHIDVLFLDVPDRPRQGFLVDIPNDETQRHLQGRRVGHPPLLAFLDIVLRFLEFILDEFQGAALREILDRENRLENLLQTVVDPHLGFGVPLQELLVGCFLNLDKVRHFDGCRQTAEVFTHTFPAREGFNHYRSSTLQFTLASQPPGYRFRTGEAPFLMRRQDPCRRVSMKPGPVSPAL